MGTGPLVDPGFEGRRIGAGPQPDRRRLRTRGWGLTRMDGVHEAQPTSALGCTGASVTEPFVPSRDREARPRGHQRLPEGGLWLSSRQLDPARGWCCAKGAADKSARAARIASGISVAVALGVIIALGALLLQVVSAVHDDVTAGRRSRTRSPRWSERSTTSKQSSPRCASESLQPIARLGVLDITGRYPASRPGQRLALRPEPPRPTAHRF